MNGGTNHTDNPVTYNVGSVVITIKDPTLVNNTFAGWIEGSAIPTGSTGNKTFTAQWHTIGINVNSEPVQLDGIDFNIIASCDNLTTVSVTAEATVTINGVIKKVYEIPDYGDNDINIIVKASNGEEQMYVLTVNKPVPFDQLVKVRWNNTLSVINNQTTNGGYNFNSYKWYRNGELIGTGQWWSVGDNDERINPDDLYYVEVTGMHTSGVSKTLRSCEACITTLKTLEVKAYPNPVFTGQTFYIEADLDNEMLEDATVEVYNMSGIRIDNLKLQGHLTSVNASYTSGVYFFILKSNDGFHKELKIIIN
jgi:hypothetical protein